MDLCRGRDRQQHFALVCPSRLSTCSSFPFVTPKIWEPSRRQVKQYRDRPRLSRKAPCSTW